MEIDMIYKETYYDKESSILSTETNLAMHIHDNI